MTRNEFKLICRVIKRWHSLDDCTAQDMRELLANEICDALLPPSSANKLARDLFLREAGVVTRGV